MLNANDKNLNIYMVYGLDIPNVVVEHLKMEFNEEIEEGKELIFDDDDTITHFFKVLKWTVGDENNVTYELLIFVFDVVKKALDGNNPVKKIYPVL